MTQFVLDASVSLGWYIDNPPDPFAIRIWDHIRAGVRPVVPPLWVFECANTLFVAERRKLLDPSASDVIAEQFEELLGSSFDVIASTATIRDLVQSSRSLQLTAYDAVYLLLAKSLDLPLATLDSSLISAARRSGVPIFS